MVLKKELADVSVSVCVSSDNFSVSPHYFLFLSRQVDNCSFCRWSLLNLLHCGQPASPPLRCSAASIKEEVNILRKQKIVLENGFPKKPYFMNSDPIINQLCEFQQLSDLFDLHVISFEKQRHNNPYLKQNTQDKL